MHLAAFNGQTVMVAPDGACSLLDDYPASFITPILKETRTADMADFAYKNLCFTLTNFFGYPGRTLLEKRSERKRTGSSPAGLRQGGTDDTRAANVGKYVRLYCLNHDTGLSS